MDQAIKIHCGLVYLQEALIIEILRVWRVAAQDHLHGLIESRDTLLEPIEVERVLNVVELYLHEELVAFEVAEPLDPTAVAAALRIKHIVDIFSNLKLQSNI